MASNPNVSPVDSDGGRREAREWNRGADSRFEWVASSPSPAEIKALERRFPEVIQVPARTLEEATSDWSQRAVIARSLSRWIPADAIVREFRRAGIAGEVESVSLAHRHFFFRFFDPAAKQIALGRPWMANGQVIAVEDWHPQFVPSKGAMATALLWVRLPSLPIEFWSEEIIGSILSAAGSFQFIDAATRERRRGVGVCPCLRPGGPDQTSAAGSKGMRLFSAILAAICLRTPRGDLCSLWFNASDGQLPLFSN